MLTLTVIQYWKLIDPVLVWANTIIVIIIGDPDSSDPFDNIELFWIKVLMTISVICTKLQYISRCMQFTFLLCTMYTTGTHKISTCASISYVYMLVNIFILHRICIAAPDLYIIFTVYIRSTTRIYNYAEPMRQTKDFSFPFYFLHLLLVPSILPCTSVIGVCHFFII